VHLTLVGLEQLTLSAFIFNQKVQFSPGSTLRSTELCIIYYFLIAPN